MRKIVILVLSVLLLCACGGNGNTSTSANNSGSAPPQSPPPPSSAPVPIPVPDPAPIPAPLVPVTKIGFLGDSITRGTYLNYSAPYKYTSYANRFRQIHGNADIHAIDGYTTQYWINKLPEIVTKYDVIFVMLGVNDSGQKLSTESYISNLKQIKNLLGCRVVFITPTPLYSAWVDQDKILSNYANAIKTEFPDTYIDLTKITFTKADYFSDDAHLLDSGHTKIFNKLMDYVNLHFIISP